MKIFSAEFFILSACFLLLNGTVYAADEQTKPQTYTWEQCVEAALSGNPELLSSQEQIKASEASRGSTRAGLLPHLNASASAQKSHREDADTKNSYSYGLSASQLIFDGLKSVYNLEAADSKLTETEYAVRVTSAGIRLELKNAFISLLKAQESVAIYQEILTRRKHVMELVQMRYNAGSEHRGSWYSSRADYLSAQASLKSAERSVILARKKLCFLMGKNESSDISVTGNFHSELKYREMPDFGAIADRNPSFLKAEAQVKSAELSMKASIAAFSPVVSGSGSAGRSGDSDRMSGNWSLGISVNAPLFSGGETWYGYKKAEAAYNQAVLDRKTVRNSVMEELQSAWNTLMDSIENVDVQKAGLDANTERSKIGEAQYSIGTLSFDNWTIIENNLSSAKKSYLEACAAALTAEAKWIKAKGGTLDNEKNN